MTFVSYAQNFEDVLLWRALGSVECGFYIDIGAWHPDADSVTRAFYDRGWRGINVEPSAEGFQRMQVARPHDLSLQMAIGATSGTTIFYALEGALSGLSTIDPAMVAEYAARGWTVHESVIRTETLAELCREHAPADVHFLKIDVEGAERAVLEGADFRTCRPWVVLLEATEPMSQVPNHATWEHLLLGADYRFVWFDGLNRYYVPAERHQALAPSFQTQPNVFDNFMRAADTEWARRIEQAETRAEANERRAAMAELRAGMAEERAAAANLGLVRTSIEVTRLQALGGQAAHLTHRAEAAEQAARDAEAWLHAMRGSTSWRVTGPMRRALRLAGRGAQAAPAPKLAAGKLAPSQPELSQPEPQAATAHLPPPAPPARRAPAPSAPFTSSTPVPRSATPSPTRCCSRAACSAASATKAASTSSTATPSSRNRSTTSTTCPKTAVTC